MNDTEAKVKKEKEKEEEKEPEDLIELFTKPTDEMDIDECRTAYEKLRRLRQVRISSAKHVNPLDTLLSKLTPDTARKFLETMGDQKKKEKEQEEEKKEEEKKEDEETS